MAGPLIFPANVEEERCQRLGDEKRLAFLCLRFTMFIHCFGLFILGFFMVVCIKFSSCFMWTNPRFPLRTQSLTSLSREENPLVDISALRPRTAAFYNEPFACNRLHCAREFSICSLSLAKAWLPLREDCVNALNNRCITVICAKEKICFHFCLHSFFIFLLSWHSEQTSITSKRLQSRQHPRKPMGTYAWTNKD